MCLKKDIYKSDCLYFQDLGTEVLVKVDTLLDANQFKFMVPNSCLFYLPDNTLILYEQITVVSSAIVCVQEKPLDVVRWNRVADSFQRFSPDVCHHLPKFSFKVIFSPLRNVLHTWPHTL